MDLKHFTKSFGKMEKALVRAAYKAGRDGLRTARTAATEYALKRKALKVAQVRKRQEELKPRGVRSFADLTWTLRITRKGTPLYDYPHKLVKSRRTKKRKAKGMGVRVQINNGAPVLLPNAFIATMKNGHTGIFLRTGSARLPIRELFTSGPAEVLSDDAAVPAVLGPARATFERTMDRVVPLEMKKLLK